MIAVIISRFSVVDASVCERVHDGSFRCCDDPSAKVLTRGKGDDFGGDAVLIAIRLNDGRAAPRAEGPKVAVAERDRNHISCLSDNRAELRRYPNEADKLGTSIHRLPGATDNVAAYGNRQSAPELADGSCPPVASAARLFFDFASKLNSITRMLIVGIGPFIAIDPYGLFTRKTYSHRYDADS